MSAVALPMAGPRRTESQARWISGPVVDVLVAFCWVPFTALALAWRDRPDLVSPLLAATFTLSLSHQPLTLALVYGDPDQFGLRRRLFTWSPLVFLVAVLVGLHVSLVLVAAIAGLWNAEHTLLQRYGLTRIYGRKVGQDDGRIERWMLQSWLVLALAWAAADPATPHRLDGLRIGATNERGVRLLASARPVATVVVVLSSLAAVALVGAWVRAERRRPMVNPAKYVYVGATALLFAVMLVDPLAGLIGYVAAHAVEYLVTVHRHLGSRYVGDAADPGGAIGRTVRSPVGRTGFVAAYLVIVVVGFALLRRHATAYTYSVLFLTAGGLHVFYDGFIWKLRRPSVAKGFAIGPQ